MEHLPLAYFTASGALTYVDEQTAFELYDDDDAGRYHVVYDPMRRRYARVIADDPGMGTAAFCLWLLATTLAIAALVLAILLFFGVGIKTREGDRGPAGPAGPAGKDADLGNITSDNITFTNDTLDAICDRCDDHNHSKPTNITIDQFNNETAQDVCDTCVHPDPTNITIDQFNNETAQDVCDTCTHPKDNNITFEQLRNDTVDQICDRCGLNVTNVTIPAVNITNITVPQLANGTVDEICGACPPQNLTNATITDICATCGTGNLTAEAICAQCTPEVIIIDPSGNTTIDNVCEQCVTSCDNVNFTAECKQDICDFCGDPMNITIDQFGNTTSQDVCDACVHPDPTNITTNQFGNDTITEICNTCNPVGPTPPCNCTTEETEDSCNLGQGWLCTVDLTQYVCDNTTGQWVSPEVDIFVGEQDGACEDGQHPGNKKECVVSWGDGLDADDRKIGRYLPYNVKFQEISWADDGDANANCNLGSAETFDIELWTSPNPAVVNFTFSKTLGFNFSLSRQEKDINVECVGGIYFALGIRNNCGHLSQWIITAVYRQLKFITT